MIKKEINFKRFDKRKFNKKERDYIKKNNIEILILPKSINKKNFLGYAIKDEIIFKDENLKNKNIILIKNNLSKKQTILTFWHEVKHFILRKKKKKLTREKKENLCEKFAINKQRG